MSEISEIEWKILLSLCFPENSSRALELEYLIKQPLDWGNLVVSSLSHRLAPALSYRLDSLNLWSSTPNYLRKHLLNILYFNRQRNSEMAAFSEQLAYEFEKNEIQYSFTKGVVLASSLYDNAGDRQLGDIDVVVPFDTRLAVSNIMTNLGFTQGECYYDRGCPSVKLFSRHELIQYTLAPDHLPHFAKAGSETYGPGTMVDFSHSVSWYNSGIMLSTNDILLESKVCALRGGGRSVKVLSEGWMFVWVVFHAFREAWFVSNRKFHKDVSLLQFRDILHLWHAYKQAILTSGVWEKLRETNGMFPISWFLSHVDDVLGTRIADELGCEREDYDYFLQFGGLSNLGPLIPWSGTMAERLRSSDRATIFDFDRPISDRMPRIGNNNWR